VAKRLRCVVHGLVQGVNFRNFTAREARRLGVAGWVRNRPDGTVELEAAGEEASLRALLDAVGRGPRMARVDRVDARWDEADAGAPGDFQVRP
jgi:acylphosphatase